MSKPGVVRVGTAGWSFEDWKGIVYPKPAPKGFHPLEYLSRFFDTLELNVTFYRPVPAGNAKSWMQKVKGNPRFKFTAKMWQRFTHEREIEPTDDEVRQVREGMDPLLREGKLGAVLLQFPWSFKRTPENRMWLARLIDTFHEYPLALEVRHSSWNQPDVFEGLAERGVGFCNIDQPLFHYSLKPSAEVTSCVGYVRLHGRNWEDWFREDAGRDERYDYLYSEEELRPWLEKIEQIRKQADEIYVITNNHYRGQAVVNAFDIQHGLGKTDFILPQHLVDEYPRLKRLLKNQLPS